MDNFDEITLTLRERIFLIKTRLWYKPIYKDRLQYRYLYENEFIIAEGLGAKDGKILSGDRIGNRYFRYLQYRRNRMLETIFKPAIVSIVTTLLTLLLLILLLPLMPEESKQVLQYLL